MLAQEEGGGGGKLEKVDVRYAFGNTAITTLTLRGVGVGGSGGMQILLGSESLAHGAVSARRAQYILTLKVAETWPVCTYAMVG